MIFSFLIRLAIIFEYNVDYNLKYINNIEFLFLLYNKFFVNINLQ